MNKMKQLSLIEPISKEHGGSLNRHKRKSFRPLHSKKFTHLVLKTNSTISLYQNREFVEHILRRQSELSGVRICQLSIQHNHIHLALQFQNRNQYKRFARASTGLLSRKFGRGIWKHRPYTRIVEWGRDYNNLITYLLQNDLEVEKLIPYQKRK